MLHRAVKKELLESLATGPILNTDPTRLISNGRVSFSMEPASVNSGYFLPETQYAYRHTYGLIL